MRTPPSEFVKSCSQPPHSKSAKGEVSRIYNFGNQGQVVVDGVPNVEVTATGWHRLDTASGRKFLVPPSYLMIEIVAEEWAS